MILSMKSLLLRTSVSTSQIKGAFVKALEILGVSKDEIVHVSAHTCYDLMPASELGIRTVLVDRGYSEEWGVKVSSLEELALMLNCLPR